MTLAWKSQRTSVAAPKKGAALLVVTMAAATLAACNANPDDAGVPDANSGSSVAQANAIVEESSLPGASRATEATSTTPTPVAKRGDIMTQRDRRQALERIARKVEKKHGGKIGIAVNGGSGMVSTGAEFKPLAWSTIKVPIALAAERTGKQDQYILDKTLKESDNATSWTLWVAVRNSVGGTEAATRKAVSKVTTKSQGNPIWPQVAPGSITPYGYAKWGIEEQARFMTSVPCQPKGKRVYKAMGDVAPWQKYGLGTVRGMHFKGGWGQHEDGTYTQRQMGVMKYGDGYLGIAVYSYYGGKGDRYSGGEAALNDVAKELRPMLRHGDFVPVTDVC